jgi:hypothetical protein
MVSRIVLLSFMVITSATVEGDTAQRVRPTPPDENMPVAA